MVSVVKTMALRQRAGSGRGRPWLKTWRGVNKDQRRDVNIKNYHLRAGATLSPCS
jgi:hypothetical protein